MVCLEPVSASPAVPIWTKSLAGNHSNNYFSGPNPYSVNGLFQTGEIQYLTASAASDGSTRLRFGYGFNSNISSGYDNRVIVAGIDKQLSENWWVTIGYQSSRSLYGTINVGAFYSIAPNASVGIGYSFYNNNDYELKSVIKTLLYIYF
jgi:hypothetical protein